MEICAHFFFVACFVLIMTMVATMDQKDCFCECKNGTNCFTLEGCNCSFPQLTFMLPYCSEGNINAIGLEMTVTGIHSTTTTLNKELLFTRDYLVSGRFSFHINSTADKYDYSVLDSRKVSLNFTILNTRLVDAGGYNLTITERPCPSLNHDNAINKRQFSHVYNLSVSERQETSPQCFSYPSMSGNTSRYTLYCSVNEVSPSVEIDILSTKPCVWRKLKSSSETAKTVRVVDFDCDLASILCETRQSGFQSATNPYDSCTFHVSATTDTVPPTLSLSRDGDTIVNKTYKGNETDFRGDHEKYVEEGDEINLVCFAEGAKPQANLTWMITGKPTEGVNSEAIRNLKENRTFDSNSTLAYNVTEEKITVICNSSLHESDVETWISATFFTYVKPNIFFEVDGSIVSNVFYLKEGESQIITCHSIGGRPLANLTWKTNFSYHDLESNLEEVTPLGNQTGVNTFNITSTIQFTADKVSDTIRCQSNIVEANVSEEAHLTVTTCAVPELSLTTNDNVSKELYINKGESVVIICNASGARPAAKLDFINSGKSMSNAITYSTKRKNVFDSSIILTFVPTNNITKIECVSLLKKCNNTKVVNITILLNDSVVVKTDDAQTSNNVWPIAAAGAVTFVILLVYCFYNAVKRYNASNSTDLSALQLALSERPANGITNASRELPAIRQSMISTHDEPSEISYNEDKISTVTDVKLTVQLPGEGTIQYWTANGSFQQESNKKIIAKCVSESAQMKEHLNFKTLADGLMTLKKHRNIVEVLGVSTSNVPYFIYTEFFEYGTLRDFLLRNYQQSRDSHTNVAQTLDETAIHLTSFALDVADALMFLTDRDYRHPALCARKILLNKMCVCKLYDFWPKTLATERMNHILQQPLPPLAWLSPETIFLRSYSKKSDVWNFGIVLWEIYSLGEIPYKGLTCEEIEQEIRKMRYLEQPLICPGGIFSMMLASWDTSVEDRPELSEWKQKLVCLLQSVKQEKEDQNGDGGNGDQKYFTLENNVCDYEDGYIEQ